MPPKVAARLTNQRLLALIASEDSQRTLAKKLFLEMYSKQERFGKCVKHHGSKQRLDPEVVDWVREVVLAVKPPLKPEHTKQQQWAECIIATNKHLRDQERREEVSALRAKKRRPSKRNPPKCMIHEPK